MARDIRFTAPEILREDHAKVTALAKKHDVKLYKVYRMLIRAGLPIVKRELKQL